MRNLLYFIFFLFSSFCFSGEIKVGIDNLFEEDNISLIKGKSVGLITNHTGVDANLKSTIEIFKEKKNLFSLKAIFSPEHGIFGRSYAYEKIDNEKSGEV